MMDDLAFRDAEPSEDDELARILYNAFLPVWNHNWFQCLEEPLASIPTVSSPLSRIQARHLAFYRSWIALVRAHSGDVAIAYTPSAANDGSSHFKSSPSPIAAVVLLLPPHARASWLELALAWRVGLLPALIGYGLTGMWRICVTFEGNVGSMISKALRKLEVCGGDETQLIFCQGCARNPEWTGGKGPARRLFDWAIRRCWERERKANEGKKDKKLTPVWLDTTTDEGIRAYEEIGFKVVGECMVQTGTDEQGFRLAKGVDAKEIEKGRQISRQRVMLRMPDSD